MSSLGGAPALRQRWNVALWTLQVLLALVFATTGSFETTKPIAELARTMGWPGSVPAPLVRLIGVVELAAAVGLLLPAATRVAPAATVVAAMGLAAEMLAATGFRLVRGETVFVPITLGLGGLAALVAWGRARRAPIEPRSRSR